MINRAINCPSRAPKQVRLLLLTLTAIFVALCTSESTAPAQDSEARYWKGNLHTHSFWSDGTDFPEMIAKWYHDRGYNFLALSDHNVLSRGERWMNLTTVEGRGTKACMQQYLDAMGEEWVETRVTDDGEKQVRLKTLEETRSLFEKPGQFIMIEGEEITDSYNRLPIHMNATNLQRLLPPVGGDSVRETIQNNLRAAEQQAAATGKPILVHLNHPNFGWGVSAEDLAAVTNERFFEVFNGHPSVRQLGDENHPSIEKMWDIVNTLRLDKLDAHPIFGLGVDDSHEYHGRPGSQPGRAWVMVRAPELTAESLIAAMERGDFYASSGVTLNRVEFDPDTGTLSVEIDGEEGVEYETRFIGTPKDYSMWADSADRAADGNSAKKTYSADVGKVFKSAKGLNPSYQLQGDELYVRALIISTKPHPNPSFDDQYEQAWTQPVGWR